MVLGYKQYLQVSEKVRNWLNGSSNFVIGIQIKQPLYKLLLINQEGRS